MALVDDAGPLITVVGCEQGQRVTGKALDNGLLLFYENSGEDQAADCGFKTSDQQVGKAQVLGGENVGQDQVVCPGNILQRSVGNRNDVVEPVLRDVVPGYPAGVLVDIIGNHLRGAECGPGGISLAQANTGQCEPGIEHCLGGSQL